MPKTFWSSTARSSGFARRNVANSPCGSTTVCTS
ncbi:Uncharacterised protein [Mycobacteroides abscessus]|nr:Uncharacterised protein [Mycobacteroides abscessus]